MKISKQIKREAKQLFRSCFVNGLLDENRARQAVQRVIESLPLYPYMQLELTPLRNLQAVR